ncbi:MAG TPA: DUF4105 domain-containing protein, partial [Candidatus Limnocylindrales bacterium]|nr:DUF4105 domain-containing protein [Candidatus Limnocylindrales bacterium]
MRRQAPALLRHPPRAIAAAVAAVAPMLASTAQAAVAVTSQDAVASAVTAQDAAASAAPAQDAGTFTQPATGTPDVQASGDQAGAEDQADTAGPGVYLVTFGPGDAVWEKFGHNGIWIRDPELGVDRIYDWGRFSFGDGFLSRFLQGYLRYWMASGPASAYFELYRRENRSIWVQELALAPSDRRALLTWLNALDTDAHRFYRYNYYLDNCSTRVRDALDAATGGALAARLRAEPGAGTFRFHTQRLTAGAPLLNAGMLLALGPRGDSAATAWDEAFIPMELREHVRDAVIAGPAGAERPLVEREWTIYESSAEPPPDAPPGLLGPMLAIGLAVAALVVGLATRARQGAARWPLALTVGVWSVIAGVLGTVLVGLWAGTEHVFTYGNENVAQMNPLSLGLAALGTVAILRGTLTRPAAALAMLIAAASLAGFALQALPGLNQVNGPIIALCLPVHLAVAWALRGPGAYGWTDARGNG